MLFIDYYNLVNVILIMFTFIKSYLNMFGNNTYALTLTRLLARSIKTYSFYFCNKKPTISNKNNYTLMVILYRLFSPFVVLVK